MCYTIQYCFSYSFLTQNNVDFSTILPGMAQKAMTKIDVAVVLFAVFFIVDVFAPIFFFLTFFVVNVLKESYYDASKEASI